MNKSISLVPSMMTYGFSNTTQATLSWCMLHRYMEIMTILLNILRRMFFVFVIYQKLLRQSD